MSCFVPQAAGAFALSGPASTLVPSLGPRRALAIALSIALLALATAAVAVRAGSLPALLAARFVLGIAARLSSSSPDYAYTTQKPMGRPEPLRHPPRTAIPHRDLARVLPSMSPVHTNLTKYY
jgi:hypothetical protein